MNINEIKKLQKLREVDFINKQLLDVINKNTNLTNNRSSSIINRLYSSEDIETGFIILIESTKDIIYKLVALLLAIPYTIIYNIGFMFKYLFKDKKYYVNLIYLQIKVHVFLLKIINYFIIGNQINYSISEKEFVEYQAELDNSIQHSIWEVFFK